MRAFITILACGLPSLVFAAMAERITRSNVAGIDVVIYPTAVKDVVTLLGALPAGDAFADRGNIAIATLTGMMLDRGTGRHDQFTIAQQLENAGASITFEVGQQSLNIQARCLKKDLPMLIGLLAEQLREPAFDPQEFDKVRDQLIGLVRTQQDNTEYRAKIAFERAVFPDGHPNRESNPADWVAAAKSAKLDEVKQFFRKVYGPKRMTLVLVGDVDPASAAHHIGKSFSGWSGGLEYLPSSKMPVAGFTSSNADVHLADKPSVTIYLGQATGLKYSDVDALALRVGTTALGSGFTGRLMAKVRDVEGLTYGIGAGIVGDTFNDGAWRIYATFAPQLLDKGIASTQRELKQWIEGGISAQELDARKTNLVGEYQASLATTHGLATALLLAIERGYAVTWLDDYPKAITALTLDQVNTAIRKHLDPNKMILVRAGTLPGS
jgi:zinc protease